jgi:hypothetical protein
MTTTTELFSSELTKRGIKFTQGQLEYVLNCKSFIGKKYKDFFIHNTDSAILKEMVNTFLELKNTTKFESDFNIL